jgi:hypothetical protein
MSLRHIEYRIFWLMTIFIAVAPLSLTGCGLQLDRSTKEPPPPLEPWNPDIYGAFISENRALIDQIYSDEYVDYPFMVDSEDGSVLIQDLINPEAVRSLSEEILPAEGDGRQILDAAQRYLIAAISYRARPGVWMTLDETLEIGAADCKGRSLLLLSLLLAANQEAYAAIGNGHMWVVVNLDGQWQTVETDPDPERRQIYSMPGFYKRPLYKIYADRTIKRKRR